MPRVVVCIPAYNEAPTIRGVVESVRALGYDVLVVDDGSTDETSFEAYLGGAVLRSQRPNCGVGVSLAEGVAEAKTLLDADIIVTFDGDAQMNPADIAPAIAALDGCDLVSGNRFMGKCEGMPLVRRILLWFIYIVFWVVSGREIRDPCSGLKVFRPSAFHIKSHRFAWAAELVFRVSRWGKVREVPMDVVYTHRSLAKGQKSSNVFRAGLELFHSLRRTT